MDLWRKVVFPIRKVWCAVSTRYKARKNGGGLLKLHNDIETCGYEDVQIMWAMLIRRSEPQELLSHHTKRNSKWTWRSLRMSDSATPPTQ